MTRATRAQAMADLRRRRPNLFVAPAESSAPAKCLPDAEQFWALEKRVAKLEGNMHRTPKIQRIVISSAFLGLLAVGVFVSLVACVAATVLRFV